ENAQWLGRKIGEERGSEMGGKSFHDHLDLESLRCSLDPTRAAVWRVRRTKVRLSAFAATVLVGMGLLTYSDLKMYVRWRVVHPWWEIPEETNASTGGVRVSMI